MSLRGKSTPLMIWQYEYVWHLLTEPLSAYELACLSRWPRRTAQSVGNQLRELVKRGWVEKDDSGIYRATDRAREAVSW